MEDVIAVRAHIGTKNEPKYFMTYGRIQDPYDPTEVLGIVASRSSGFATGGLIDSLEICGSLGEASRAPLFFEALLSFAWKSPEYGPTYEQWRQRVDAEMRNGKHIYFMG